MAPSILPAICSVSPLIRRAQSSAAFRCLPSAAASRNSTWRWAVRLRPRSRPFRGRMDHRKPQTEDRDAAFRHPPFHQGQGGKLSRLHRWSWRGECELSAPPSDFGTGAEAGGRGGRRRRDDRSRQRHRCAPGFAIGVQWHPEYWVGNDEISDKIFAAFRRRRPRPPRASRPRPRSSADRPMTLNRLRLHGYRSKPHEVTITSHYGLINSTCACNWLTVRTGCAVKTGAFGNRQTVQDVRKAMPPDYPPQDPPWRCASTPRRTPRVATGRHSADPSAPAAHAAHARTRRAPPPRSCFSC